MADESIPGVDSEVAVEELIRSDQAVYISLLVMLLTAAALYFYNKRVREESQKESLNIKYQFGYPKEKLMYEKKIQEEPDPEDFQSETEFNKKRQEWLKEASGILLRRAIMDLNLNAKVSQDYNSYFMIYKSGINLDIWQSVKAARELIGKELQVVQQEAEWLQPGWGATIFNQANQLRMHMLVKQNQQKNAQNQPQQPQAGSNGDSQSK